MCICHDLEAKLKPYEIFLPHQEGVFSTSISAQLASAGLAADSGISRSLHSAGNRFVLRFNSPAGIPESAAPQTPGGIIHIDNGPFDNEEKKKVFCEVLAQACFNFLSIGAVSMATVNCGGNGLYTTLTVMATHFVILPLIIFAFGPVSGAHFNPMVTTVMVLTGLLRATTGLGYIVAQCFGGIIGAAAWWNLLPAASRQLSMIGAQGAPADHSVAQIFGGEVAASLLLHLGAVWHGGRQEGLGKARTICGGNHCLPEHVDLWAHQLFLHEPCSSPWPCCCLWVSYLT
ncbi:hypothetical protein WJX84_004077 [Apatococcus fuscideae]|uniref:Uncharacterized protein n=1 Tax=Apatococcus fuscideae TaxID=2026836 RepID=A0AAW1SRR5_9CHLO